MIGIKGKPIKVIGVLITKSISHSEQLVNNFGNAIKESSYQANNKIIDYQWYNNAILFYDELHREIFQLYSLLPKINLVSPLKKEKA